MHSFIRLNNKFQTVIHKINIFQSRFSDFVGYYNISNGNK